MTIQRDEEKRWTTTSQFARKVIEAIRKMSEYEKAKLRVRMREYYGLPPERERALEN
jgi:hypothetical protein